jgi:Spy/CpxP family protein refolding chaperone
MRLANLFAAAALLAAAPALATAATTVPVDRFNAVELHGGGAKGSAGVGIISKSRSRRR